MTVIDVNLPPVIDIPAELTVKAGSVASIPFLATDPDGGEVTVDLAACVPSPPFEVSIDAAASALRIIPGPNAAGRYCVRVTATDDALPPLSTTRQLTLVVNADAAGPVIVPIPPQSATEGDLLTFPVTATDPAGPAPALSLDAGALPPGSDAALAGGVFTWTPDAGTARDIPYRVTIRAAGSLDLSTSLDVSILVGPRDRIPPSPPAVISPDTEDGLDDGLLRIGAYTIRVDGPSDAARLRFFQDGVLMGESPADGQGDAGFSIETTACGRVVLAARAVDAAGNESADSLPLALDFAQPAAASLQVEASVASPAAGEGTVLTVTALDPCGLPIPGFQAATLAVARAGTGASSSPSRSRPPPRQGS